MGSNLTRALTVVVGVVAVFGSVRPARTQNVAPEAPLAVRMPDDATGVDVKAVVQIAIRMGVPVGFEEVAALAEGVSAPRRLTREPPIVSVRPTPLDVRGVTLRDALDAVVAKDRRYAWKPLDGVVVVRPVAAWRDSTHPLLLPMRAVRLEDATLAAVNPLGDDGADERLLDRLNATVRARGRHYWVLARSSAQVLLDRGRAVEVVEPSLRLGSETGEETLRLRWR